MHLPLLRAAAALPRVRKHSPADTRGAGCHGANAIPARGLPRDRRAPHESSSQHWGVHKPADWEKLRKKVETAKDDPEAVQRILREHGIRIWEGQDIEDPGFWLGPDPPDPEPKKPRPKKPGGGGKRGRKK